MSVEKLLDGMRPTPLEAKRIENRIRPEVMVDDYARQLVLRIESAVPVRFKSKPIIAEDVVTYFRYILTQRVKQVDQKPVQWYKLKNLIVPEFLAQTLASMGRVEYFEYGRLYIPVLADDVLPKMTKEELEIFELKMMDISSQLSFYMDVIRMFRDAFPRTIMGDYQTANCAIVGDALFTAVDVKSLLAIAHSSFLGYTLAKDSWFNDHMELRAESLSVLKWLLINSEEVMGVVNADRRETNH